MSTSFSIDLGIRALKPTDGAAYKEQLKAATQEFESILLNHMMKVMRDSVPDVELLGHDSEREFYEDMLNSEFARSGAHAQGFGFGQLLYETLSRHVDDLNEPVDQSPKNEVNHE